MRKKILIIDSDAKDRNAMAQVLSIVGFKNVMTARTGEEGIEKVKSYKPKVVVIALALLDRKGFEVCKEIKAMEGVEAKVVLITGKLDVVEPSWAENSEADEFLVKSSSYETLCRTVARLI